ncbi:hypothetical protein [Endozoicomonas sp. OPT23]|uniref:hypothetical protein n=1 Tax=Endozoicomonas sp. OPT23 TaxID=2072845 RepID=UPI001891647D|nr:hypothetical protein [Endozoicomonas sp. OPT23]
MLDSEVRRIVGNIEKSNELLVGVNNMINKANIAQYGSSNYTATTWQTNGNSIVLDNGYGLAIHPDANGNTKFTLVDAEGNKLMYQNQTLVPLAKGEAADVLQVGIPVMNDMTFVLDDGTEITFKTGTPDIPFNAQNISGGLTDITGITITRGTQSLTVTNLNTANPAIGTANLNGVAVDATNNDGYILLESGGLHSWEYDGVNTNNITATDPNNASAQLGGYAARKLAFQSALANEYSGGAPVLSAEERNILAQDLKITYTDVSGNGNLTPDEWGKLKSSLLNAKENLTSNNQLQTVQLQRAMATYNQNYDAMSNSQNKIYSLLRDIINNVK